MEYNLILYPASKFRLNSLLHQFLNCFEIVQELHSLHKHLTFTFLYLLSSGQCLIFYPTVVYKKIVLKKLGKFNARFL